MPVYKRITGRVVTRVTFSAEKRRSALYTIDKKEPNRLETIHNHRLYDQYIESRQIRSLFSGELPRFLLLHYAPGDLLTTPLSPSGFLQLVVDGELLLYDMPDENSTVSIRTDFHRVNILGDMELLDMQFTTLFVEAKTDVYTLALYLEQHRQRLLADPIFLRCLCTSMAEKLNGAVMASNQMTLRQKVRLSLCHAEPGQRISGIAAIAESLNVSSRQLMRVLKEFCELGVLSHEKKGEYRVLKKPE